MMKTMLKLVVFSLMLCFAGLLTSVAFGSENNVLSENQILPKGVINFSHDELDNSTKGTFNFDDTPFELEVRRGEPTPEIALENDTLKGIISGKVLRRSPMDP